MNATRIDLEKTLSDMIPSFVRDEIWTISGGDPKFYDRLRVMVEETWSAGRNEGYDEGRFSATYENRD